MLVVGLLKILGLIILGFLITPLMFYLLGTIIAVIVLALNLSVRLTMQKSLNSFLKIFKKFLWSPNSIMYHSKNNIPSVPNLKTKHYGEGNPNNRHFDTPNQAVATKLEKVCNVSHRIILFYKSYYGLFNESGKEPPQ